MVQTEQRVNDGLKPLSYHESLMQLRKSWRLKLMQSVVLGDASLRSIGSRAKEGGNFEVFGSDASKNQSSGFGPSPDVIKVRFSSTMESLLEKDLCTGRLRVSIKELNHKRPNSWQEFLERPSKKPVKICNLESPLSTSKRLCLAHNLLACREILSTLSFEASLLGVDKSKTDIVAFSSQGKVVATVFPGFQISVSLEKLNGDLAEDGCYDHPGLRTQLKRLLFLQHMASWSNIASAPNPPTGPVQVPRRLRAAGATTTLQNSTLSSCEGVPIITACVAGFGGPAASSWMAAQNQAFQTSSLRANQVFAAPVGQERYSYFNDWAINHQQPAIDDVVPSSLTLSGLEHALRSSQASTAAISCVLGSGESLLTQLISLAKHRVLRERVSKCLTGYARTEAAPGMCVLALWHSINSPLSSSVNVTFHSAGYSSFRSRLTICVGVNSISVYGACGSSQPIIIPATADTKTHLWRVLKAQEFGNQMFTLQGLASKLLGWIQLGCTAAASPSASATTPRDAVLMGSRSGNRLVCIRGGGSNSGGLELFVAKTTQDDLSSLASNGELFQTAMSVPKTLDFGRRSRLDFRQVDLSRLPGRHVVAKIESLLTCLSDA
uniref:Mediator of RNA polymerase II transcription subunit 13 n=1 Tax=Mesocestoides corti TaxID=53468 RepID=A0A5K3EI35_MESCO